MLRTTGLRDVAIWLARRARLERRRAFGMKKYASVGWLLGQAEGLASAYRHAFQVALQRLKKGRR